MLSHVECLQPRDMDEPRRTSQSSRRADEARDKVCKCGSMNMKFHVVPRSDIGDCWLEGEAAETVTSVGARQVLFPHLVAGYMSVDVGRGREWCTSPCVHCA